MDDRTIVGPRLILPRLPVIGPDSFFDNTIGKKIDNVLYYQDKLSDLEDPQLELLLLQSCLSLYKVNHLLRTFPSGKVNCHLEKFDTKLRSCLEAISCLSLSDSSWKQATLLVCHSGLGLRESCRTAPTAFTGSCNSTRDLIRRLLGYAQSPVLLIVPGEMSSHEHLLSMMQSTTQVDLWSSTQHQLQEILDKSLFLHVKNSMSLRNQARLHTISTPHAGSWLGAILNKNLGFVMFAD